jgi:hypothetical protein
VDPTDPHAKLEAIAREFQDRAGLRLTWQVIGDTWLVQDYVGPMATGPFEKVEAEVNGILEELRDFQERVARTFSAGRLGTDQGSACQLKGPIRRR